MFTVYAEFITELSSDKSSGLEGQVPLLRAPEPPIGGKIAEAGKIKWWR